MKFILEIFSTLTFIFIIIFIFIVAWPAILVWYTSLHLFFRARDKQHQYGMAFVAAMGVELIYLVFLGSLTA